MGLVKRTYALPPDTLDRFERLVPPGKRGPLVAQVLGDWLERRRREQLRKEVIEGCREMADVYLRVEKDFHPLDEEVDRGIGDRTRARRRRTGAARSRRRV